MHEKIRENTTTKNKQTLHSTNTKIQTNYTKTKKGWKYPKLKKILKKLITFKLIRWVNSVLKVVFLRKEK